LVSHRLGNLLRVLFSFYLGLSKCLLFLQFLFISLLSVLFRPLGCGLFICFSSVEHHRLFLSLLLFLRLLDLPLLMLLSLLLFLRLMILFLLRFRVLRALFHALTSSISLLEIITHLNVSILFNIIFVLRKIRHTIVTSASVHRNNFPIYQSQ
jgi:hypothetical protein